MAKITNPFIASGKIPPEYFCDRVEEAKLLEQSLVNQQNVILTSTRMQFYDIGHTIKS